MLAPYSDPGCAIWACGPDNAGPGGLPRINAWFEVHGDLGTPHGPAWEPTYIGWLNGSKAAGHFGLYAQDLRLFPQATRLPFEQLVNEFGRLPFTSSLAWMFAYALAVGVKKIGLYGMDMSSREEYILQRPGVQYLIGIAERDYQAEVYAPMESDILAPPPLYGFQYSSPFGRKLLVRRREIEARVSTLDAEMARMRSERDSLAGALDDIDYNQAIWTGLDAAQPVPDRQES